MHRLLRDRRAVGLAAFGVLCLVGCAAVLPFMDLVTSDSYAPVVVNDTSRPVRVAMCVDETCTRREAGSAVRVAAHGRTTALRANVRGGDVFAVLGASGRLAGCVTPPLNATGGELDSKVVRISGA